MIERILKIEEDYKDKEQNALAKVREERDIAMKERLTRINNQLDEFGKLLRAEEDELETKYLKLEENLRNKSLWLCHGHFSGIQFGMDMEILNQKMWSILCGPKQEPSNSSWIVEQTFDYCQKDKEPPFDIHVN